MCNEQLYDILKSIDMSLMQIADALTRQADMAEDAFQEARMDVFDDDNEMLDDLEDLLEATASVEEEKKE